MADEKEMKIGRLAPASPALDQVASRWAWELTWLCRVHWDDLVLFPSR